MQVLITGANGFIGRALTADLNSKELLLKLVVRSSNSSELIETPKNRLVEIAEINGMTDWRDCLSNVDVVVHLAAVTHQSAFDSDYHVFKQVNVEGTRQLLEACIKARVKRFIFVSSIKVYGEAINSITPLDESSQVGTNCDYYGRSKLEAEQWVEKLCSQNSIEFVIIRPPLVYGPGVGSNFYSLLNLLQSGVPLPFAKIQNSRSMISIENLVNFISLCVVHKAVSNQIYVISDNDDISLIRLITLVRKTMGMSPRLFYFPYKMMQLLTGLIGKEAQLVKLAGSLVVTPGKAHNQLGWQPPMSVEAGVKNTVQFFLENKK